jgi:translocation and assembly module TamB
MKKRLTRRQKCMLMAFSALLAVVLCLGAAFTYFRSAAFMDYVSSRASELLTASVGTEVRIGRIEVRSARELSLHDIAIYDKQAECLAQADEARVSLGLLSAWKPKSQPVEWISEIALDGLSVHLIQREDGAWNIEDLQSESSQPTPFAGKVTAQGAEVTVTRQGKSLTLTNVDGCLDASSHPSYHAELSAENQGASVEAEATLSSLRQIVNARVEHVNLENYLSFVPEGLIPEGVEIQKGTIENARGSLYRAYDTVSFLGEGQVKDGSVDVQGLHVENIGGFVHFTNRELGADLTADAAGQPVSAKGTVRFDTDSPAMDLTVEARDFAPSAVLSQLPKLAAASGLSHQVSGRFDVNASVKGTFADPMVDGTIASASAELFGVPLENLSAHLRFLDGSLYVQEVRAGVFSGSIVGEAAYRTADQYYTGHLKFNDLHLDTAGEALSGLVDTSSLPALSGRAFGDVGFSGRGADVDGFEAFGSLSLAQADYASLPIDDLRSSFALKGRTLQIDALSARLPHGSSIGLEGAITGLGQAPALDLSFYGGHVDTSLFVPLLKQIVPQLGDQADLSGFGDFSGQVSGAAADPQVSITFSAVNGRLFQQPFDSLELKASGSLDGVKIDDFLLENGGKNTWLAWGSIGLVGERKLDLRVDCVGARMEDIAALVAPDQPITGNVDNTIHFTGTLDHPQAVGYIHFYRGSYRGVLLSGMDGDYYLQDDAIRLQVFHIYSPMVDAVLNGTIGLDQSLALTVDVRDADMKRIGTRLPYEVSGHGSFEGTISGTIAAPVFDGVADAGKLTLNGVDITQLHGRVHYADGVVGLQDFGFTEGKGSYDMALTYTPETQGIDGLAELQNVDVHNLCSLLGQKDVAVEGTLTSSAEFSGTLEHPGLRFEGKIPSGKIAGYDVHDLSVLLHMDENRVVTIDRFEGAQGDKGKFSAKGTVALDGPIDASFHAQGISLGLFTKAAGLSADVIGTADIDAVFGDTLKSPSADVKITAQNGGVQGSTFDSLDGKLKLSHGIVNVENLVVSKTVGSKKKTGKTYHASASGVVPLKALTAKDTDELDDIDQIKLHVALDDADLSLLPMLSKEIAWAEGPTQGSLDITGTGKHPRLDGSFSIPDGAMKIKALEIPLEHIKGTIRFNGNVMTMDAFSGKMGKGDFSAKGSVTMDGLTPKSYDLDCRLNALDIRSSFYRGPLTGEFHVSPMNLSAPDNPETVRTIPKISGHLDLDDCQVSIPSLPDSSGDLPEAGLDITVSAGKKVHFYSAFLYDMYLTGAVHFGGTTRQPQSSGSFSVKRGGTVSYLKTVFDVEEGVANFDQFGSFYPSITFRANTKLGHTKVFLRITGPLDQMKFQLTSRPELSETEIIRLLTLHRDLRSGNDDISVGDLLSIGLGMGVLSELEEQMREVLWLDRFSISRGSGSVLSHDSEQQGESKQDDETYHVDMGKYLTKNFLFHYVRGIGENVNRYGVQYDLSDYMGLTYDHEDGRSIFGIEARYPF